MKEFFATVKSLKIFFVQNMFLCSVTPTTSTTKCFGLFVLLSSSSSSKKYSLPTCSYYEQSSPTSPFMACLLYVLRNISILQVDMQTARQMWSCRICQLCTSTKSPGDRFNLNNHAIQPYVHTHIRTYARTCVTRGSLLNSFLAARLFFWSVSLSLSLSPISFDHAL